MKTEIDLRRERRIGWIIGIIVLTIGGAATVTLQFITPRSRVPSKAMVPTIHAGDHVFINRLAYAFGTKPRAGEVITFRFGKERTKNIFRVVAVPGDTIQMRDNVVFRNGKEQDEPYIVTEPDIPAVRSFGPVQVPPDSYFVLGDNRDNANDSRFLGFVEEDRIIGKMIYVWHIGDCMK